MKYEIPELTALTSAINAVQTAAPKPGSENNDGSPTAKDGTAGYEDWE
jgi:hypothetical protein